jgi:ribosome maturation factor RimP
LVIRAGRDWAVREVALGDIIKAVVQVEFSPPGQAELELAGIGQARRTEAGA